MHYSPKILNPEQLPASEKGKHKKKTKKFDIVPKIYNH